MQIDPIFVGLSIAVFSGVILILTLLLQYASKKLVSSGDVKIVINGDTANPVITASGSTLLSTLSGNKILLPSACGGGGTCALCKCQVFEGGGDVLATEQGHLTRAMQKDHWRLACQVKVKNDLVIKVPDEVFSIKKWECEVESNKNVATYIKEFVVKLPPGENLEFEAGGYIQIDIPEYDLDFRKDMLINCDDKSSRSCLQCRI